MGPTKNSQGTRHLQPSADSDTLVPHTTRCSVARFLQNILTFEVRKLSWMDKRECSYHLIFTTFVLLPYSLVFKRMRLFGKQQELDGVPRTQTSRLLLSYYNYTAVEATALLFVQQHVKGAIIVYHVTPPHGRKWPLYRMIVRELRQ